MPTTIPISELVETSSVFILVMGITGAGKSTFIQNATGDSTINVGDGLESETKEVQESIVMMEDDHGKPVAVHLIDTPGFDDDFDSDPNVLDKIATWTNRLYENQEHISGVLYLHNVSLTRMRGSGVSNLEMIPQFIGDKKLNFLTLLTTHWDTLRDSSREINNEESLRTDFRYWRGLLDGPGACALMRRFNNTTKSALEIIKEHLRHKFVPSLNQEMIDESLPLCETNAGQIVTKNLDQAYRVALMKAANDTTKILALEKRYELVSRRLREKFDKKRSLEYQQKVERLKRKQRVFRAVRWVGRASIAAGIVTTIVLTGGFAAPVVAVQPIVEVWAQIWSANDRERRQRLENKRDDYSEADFREFQMFEQLEDEDENDINGVVENDLC